MTSLAALAPALLARARADQVALLYASWHRTSLSMLLGAALLCFVLWGQASPWWIGGMDCADRRESGMARCPRAGVGTAASRHRGHAALGSLLVRRVDAGRRIVGTRIAGHVSAIGGPPGAADRVRIRRRVGRTQPHGSVPALVLRVRAAGAGSADRARRAGRRPGPPVYGAGDDGRAGVHPRLRAPVERCAHPIAGNAVRKHRPHRGAKGKSRAAHDARTAAEAANRAKSQLLAAASHDLRQPLHAVGLYIAALAARATEPEWRPLVGSMQRAVAALEGQFEQLLDLSRLEAGALNPESVRVAVAPLFARVATEFEPQADAKGSTLRAAASRLAVRSDPALLERIVRNLVANAVRYTESGGVLIGTRLRGLRSRSTSSIRALASLANISRASSRSSTRSANRAAAARTPGWASGSRSCAGSPRCSAIVSNVVSRVGRGSRFRVLAPRSVGAREGSPTLQRRKIAVPHAGPASLRGALVAVIDDDPSAVDAMTRAVRNLGRERRRAAATRMR